MIPTVQSVKGQHPGIVLEKILKERGIKHRPFAAKIHERPPSLVAILKGRKAITPRLSIEIERALDIKDNEGYFFLLQAYYELAEAKAKLNKEEFFPDLTRIRPTLFWDMGGLKNVEWQRKKRSVIRRVLKRGNKTEIREICRFYGRIVVANCLPKKDPIECAAIRQNLTIQLDGEQVADLVKFFNEALDKMCGKVGTEQVVEEEIEPTAEAKVEKPAPQPAEKPKKEKIVKKAIVKEEVPDDPMLRAQMLLKQRQKEEEKQSSLIALMHGADDDDNMDEAERDALSKQMKQELRRLESQLKGTKKSKKKVAKPVLLDDDDDPSFGSPPEGSDLFAFDD